MKKKNLVVLDLLLIGIGIYFFFGKSVATDESTILKDQVVDGLSFEDANLDYNNGVSTLVVNVTNENKDVYNLKYIEIKFGLSDEDVTLIGYVGETINQDEKKIITASIDKDITNATSLEYVINK